MNYCRLSLTLIWVLLLGGLSAQHTGNIHRDGIQAHSVERYPDRINAPGHGLPVPRLDANYFQIQVDALHNQVPDAYLAIFNVVQLGKSAPEADLLLQKRLDTFMIDLGLLGIQAGDIFIDMISQVPIYEYQLQKKVFSKSYQEVPSGVELQKNLHIRFHDGNLMGKIVTLASKVEIYELVKVDYLIQNQEEVYFDLMEKAIQYAQRQLKAYEALGVRYDTLPLIFNEIRETTYPLQRYISYQSKSGSALQNKFRDSSQVKQFRQPQTIYYQSLPVDQYEIVVNPLVKEPVVQFSYHLLLRYQRHSPKPEIRVEKQIQREKEYIILTPDGRTQTLHLEKMDDS